MMKAEVLRLLNKTVDQRTAYEATWNIHDKYDTQHSESIRFLDGQISAYQRVPLSGSEPSLARVPYTMSEPKSVRVPRRLSEPPGARVPKTRSVVT